MTDLHQTFDVEVRRTEPNLWLASRLVPEPATRAAVTALYALHVELAKVSGAVSNPLAAEIRLAWWREEVEALTGARAVGHPALQALKDAAGLDLSALDAMIEGRHAELEPRPFTDEAALLAYLDGVDGGLMRAAAGLLAPGLKAPLLHTARAWGWSRLLPERAAWRAKARDWTPAAWGEPTDAEIAAHVRHQVSDALKAAEVEVAALPPQAFPAVAYAALAASYSQGRRPSDLGKRVRLLWATLRGRIS